MDTTDYKTTKHEGIKANPSNTEILLDFRINKKRYRKKLHFTKTHGDKTDRLKLAYNALEEYKKEIKHSSTLGDVSTMDMDAYFIRTEALSKRGDATKKKLTQFYNSHIKDEIGELKPRDIKPAHITAVMTKLKEKGLALSTQKKALEVLVPIFKLALDEEVISKTPIKKMHLIQRDSLKEKKIIMSAEDKYRRVYRQIFLTFAHNKKIMALVLLCFHGRRITEASRLVWDDIDLNNNTYRIRAANSKVGSDMLFTLPDDVALILSDMEHISSYVFYSEHNIDTYVTDIRHHTHKLRDDTGIQELTLHWLRNLAVSALSAMGVSALELSTLLGHTDPNTLRQYLTMQREATTKKINKISQKTLLSKQ